MIPLPDEEARISMIRRLLKDHQHSLTEADFEDVASATDGYSGSDLAALAKDAAMGPIREIDPTRVPTLKHKEVCSTNLGFHCHGLFLWIIFPSCGRFGQ
jgi:SpoVK/Ycf46/Vps4 family AAA+-type ATPase